MQPSRGFMACSRLRCCVAPPCSLLPASVDEEALDYTKKLGVELSFVKLHINCRDCHCIPAGH